MNTFVNKTVSCHLSAVLLSTGTPAGYNPIIGDESRGDAPTSHCARDGINRIVWRFDPHES
jgi:hypothetical protein